MNFNKIFKQNINEINKIFNILKLKGYKINIFDEHFQQCFTINKKLKINFIDILYKIHLYRIVYNNNKLIIITRKKDDIKNISKNIKISMYYNNKYKFDINSEFFIQLLKNIVNINYED